MKLHLVRLMIGVAFAVAAIVAFRAYHHSGFAVLAVVIFLYLSALMIAIAFLLDYPRLPRQPKMKKMNEIASELECSSLLASSTFTAERAFRVQQFGARGPHYFLELDSGAILHLSGIYLYDYEPGEGYPRHFPCSNFTVRRHAELGHVVDIVCSGVIIEPEFEAPSYTQRDFALGIVPRDGEILRNLTFDQLRQQHLGERYRTH